MIDTNPKTLNCTVSRMVYPRDIETFDKPQFVILLTSIGHALGILPFCPKPGMKLRLHGHYEEKNGRLQFRFSKVKHDAPEDSLALLKYVATLTKGVGEKAVEKIYAQFGDDWRKRLDELPPNWALPMRRTLDALATDADRLDAIKFILSKGGTPRIADLAFQKWKSATISTVTADPYLLSTLDGIGFKTVDNTMREKFGIGENDTRRAIAAVDYTMRELLESSGDSIVSRDDLYAAIADLRVPHDVTALALQKLVKDNRIIYVGLDQVTNSAVVRWEYDLARYAVEKNGERAAYFTAKWPDGFSPDKEQADAANAVLSHVGLTVINGGAGVGKTTIIRAIADSLKEDGESYVLCAFAGKAAARLREATGHQASTIHSLLQSTGNAGFRAGSLEGQTIIVDEASMVPSALLYEITKRNPKRLVLVGDEAQLQPVGIGSPFHDVIDTLPTLVHNLKTCYRNEEAVFSAAQKIRVGIAPSSAHSKREDFAIVPFKDPQAAQNRILELVCNGTIDFHEDLVLAPRNGEGEAPMPCSVNALNAAILPLVNRHNPGERFKVGDRVMCRKNCPALDIWNGTCGWITHVDIDGTPYFQSDDNGATVRVTDREVRDSFVDAYALTVHKSQGSQYRDVYILCMKRDDGFLFDRSMLYTAVTRARRGCYIFTDNGIDRVVNAVHRRHTYLQMLLKGEA